jgi:hypothetical protein
MNDIKLLYDNNRLDELLEMLDDLHTAASDNTLQSVTSLNERELLGLLREVVFTAQETIAEVEAHLSRKVKATPANILRLVPKDNVQETRHA